MTLQSLKTFARRSLAVLPVLCLAGSVTSSLQVHPHSLAYFNEAAGGPENGHKHMLGSNLDWGQDLLFVKSWMARRGLQAHQVRFVSYYPYPLERLLSSGVSDPEWAIVSTTKVLEPYSRWSDITPCCCGIGVHSVRVFPEDASVANN